MHCLSLRPGEDKAFDGTTLASVTLSDDRIAGDDLSLGYESAEFADCTAGNHKPIDVSGIAASGADAGNYVWNTSAQATAKITGVDTESEPEPEPMPNLPLTLDGILPEINGSTPMQSGASASEYTLVNHGILLPSGVDEDENK